MSTVASSLDSANSKQRLHALLKEKQRRQAQQAQCALLENDLGAFFRESWNVLEPGRKLAWSWHYDLLAEYLWLVREGKFQERYPGIMGIIVNVSPRTAKSSFLSICYPVWTWLKEPARRFLCASYSSELSTEHSLRRRDLIQSTWFQELWGSKFKLKSDQNVKHHFENDQTGAMTSTSVGGTSIGRGGDTLILDDPISATQALSEIERSKANNWIDHSFRSRINDPSSGLIIMVMQRLHDLDPTGFLLNSDPDRWLHIKLPLEAEEPEEWKFPVSGRVVIRQVGEILQPDRFNPLTVGRLKNRRLIWAGQHQQRPTPLEGNMIKRGDVRWYGGMDSDTGIKDDPLPPKFDLVIVSADCAFKDLATSDYVAVGAVGIKGNRRYVLNIVNKHLDLEGTETEIKRQVAEYGAGSILVEDKANGSAVIKRLKRELVGVIAIEPEGGKIARMFAAAPEWQAGNWYVDRNAMWAEAFLDQLMKFPNAAHDDMVDAMTQCSNWLHRGSIGMFQLYGEQAEGLNKNNSPSGAPFVPQQPQTSGMNQAAALSAGFNPWGVFGR